MAWRVADRVHHEITVKDKARRTGRHVVQHRLERSWPALGLIGARMGHLTLGTNSRRAVPLTRRGAPGS